MIAQIHKMYVLLHIHRLIDTHSDLSYDNYGRARWGAGGALYPQSAIAGLNSSLRCNAFTSMDQSGADAWVLCDGGL